MTIKRYLVALSSLWEYLIFKDMVSSNYIRGVRARYVRRYKDESEERKLIAIDEMAMLINSTLDIRDKAIITFLAKTGIRRNELITLDLSDVDLIDNKNQLRAATPP